MSKLLIDCAHPEEARMAVVNDKMEILELDISTHNKRQIRGNIYLARVVKTEPSLQAIFVEFGENRQGFIPLSELHPSYSGCDSLSEYFEKIQSNKIHYLSERSTDRDGLQRMNFKKNQLILVQAIKEERGSKGPVLSTYISIPGRLTILMPNTVGGGISKRIQNNDDRKRLKDIIEHLHLPSYMSIIVRTAGEGSSEKDIEKDSKYCLAVWNAVQKKALELNRESLIYEEGDIVKRAIRDVYQPNLDEIIVEGKEAFKKAQAIINKLHAPGYVKIKRHDDPVPLFQKFGVDAQINAMLLPQVYLPSGGSIIINQTEALVTIDVNSRKSTKSRSIHETARNTNLEAAVEIAKQLRLRDLSGIIIIDFIDMSNSDDIALIEKTMKESVKEDRARIQVGKISTLGLLEICRQRMRPSLLETYTKECAHCFGAGLVRATESCAIHVLRHVEKQFIEKGVHFIVNKKVTIFARNDVSEYMLNQKRDILYHLEQKYRCSISVFIDNTPIKELFRLEIDGTPVALSEPILFRPSLDGTKQIPLLQDQDLEPERVSFFSKFWDFFR